VLRHHGSVPRAHRSGDGNKEAARRHGVCLINQRDPIQTAKLVASIDQLPSGRFLFGVGNGWHKEAMEHHTLSRERIEAMKKIWTQDTADYHGEFVNLATMQTWPKPAQRPYPPLIVGGAFPYGARRAVRNGDGWIPSAGGPGRTDIATTLPQFRKLATEAGRDPASLPVTLFRVTEDLDRRHQFRDLGIARGHQPAGHGGGCDPADTRPLGTVDALRHRLTCPMGT
jgi:alkanesulfonate monooxygenase SsuD/methylene tetrahydromethanopterin reductase-like flavin-dependent oxidoreductase (luciferase family)